MRLIMIIIILGVLGTGGYLLWKNNGNVKKAVDEARQEVNTVVGDVSGYPDAKTPKEAADLFRKAIRERKYESAAKYCTDSYAEILKKCSTAANKLGTSIDNVTYQLNEHSLNTDEMKLILYFFDPFPKELLITVSNVTDKDAVASLTPEGINLTGSSLEFSNWHVDTRFWGALYLNLPRNIKIVKQGENWKLDFPIPAELQVSSTRLNDKYKTYVQRLDKLSREIKNDPETKEKTKTRMKELLEDAAKD